MPATLYEVQVHDTTIPVIFEQDNHLPLVSMQLVFQHSGALTDTKPGLAKLASRLLGEGSEAMGSEVFAEALESKAITLHASVGAETFVISLNALKSEFAFGLKMLIELLQDPNYTSEAFSKVQTQTIGALTQKQSDFDYVASLLLKSTLFEGSARAYPPSGTPESVTGIGLDEVKIFLQAHLGRENLIVVLGGDVEETTMTQIISDVSAALPLLDIPALDIIQAQTQSKTVTQKVATEQAYLYFGAPYTMPYDSGDVYLGKVAGACLLSVL